MNDISIPILKINSFAKDPEKLSNNVFKFFADQDYDIFPESANLISSGFYLKGILFQVIPSEIYINLNCLASTYVSEDSRLFIDCLSYEKTIKNKYSAPFAKKVKLIKKDTCIFYLLVVSSDYEKNYSFDINY